MEPSFGIEFEFDLILKNGRRIRDVAPRARRFVDGWDYQDDHTCAVELRSPVFRDLDHAVSEIERQFNYWCDVFQDVAPYPYSVNGRSLGMHIHIGLPNRCLHYHEVDVVGKSVANVYPFLAALQCQPVPSERILRSAYLRPLWAYDYEITDDDHYAEINFNAIGTVEFRIFDANVPQVALVNAWIMREIAKVMLENQNLDVRVNRERYRHDRNMAIRYGLKALNILNYLQMIKNMIGNVAIPSYPFVRELLYLAVKYRMNAWDIMRAVTQSLGTREFEYFRAMFKNPRDFMSNVMSVINNSMHDVVDERCKQIILDALENSRNLNTLDDLIALARTFAPEVPSIYVIPFHSKNLPSRSYVKRCIDLHYYRVCRINEVDNTPYDDVAGRIHYLMRHHGDGFVNVLSPEDVINRPERFYVFVVPDPDNRREVVLGCIAVRMSTGEISSLVVDRRYRRLGIAKILIKTVMRVFDLHYRNSSRPILHGYVKKKNEPMINLLRSMGFVIEPFNQDVYRFRVAVEGCD
jgi:GNAT superfamily N-acetyltransferase